jgi:hypothetical protein
MCVQSQYHAAWIFETGADCAMILSGYFDESGHSDVFVIAGFVGDRDQWSFLESEWGKVTKGRRIHLSEMRINNTTERLLGELAPVPSGAELQPVYVSVRRKHFADMLDGNGERLFFNSYAICLQGLLPFLHKQLDPTCSIKLVFESNRLMDAHAEVVFERHQDLRTTDGRFRFPSREVFVKDACPLLETADYLSFALSHRLTDPTSKKAKWSAPILDSCKPRKFEFSRTGIRNIVAELKGGSCDFGLLMADYLKQIRRERYPHSEDMPI